MDHRCVARSVDAGGTPAQRDPGHEVGAATNLRVRPGRILVPDLAVVTEPGADDVVAGAAPARAASPPNGR